MPLKGSGVWNMIGYGICGSFCTHEKSLQTLQTLARRYEVLPVLSFNAASLDTRFGKAKDLVRKTGEITGQSPVMTIVEAEPLGPKTPMEAFIIAPCTGNTLAKIASGITDTPVTMAAKAHLRNGRPLVLAPSTNDGLSASAGSIGALLNRKYIYFVPFGQDDPEKKPASRVADFAQVADAAQAALEGRQLQPLLLGR